MYSDMFFILTVVPDNLDEYCTPKKVPGRCTYFLKKKEM